MGRRCSHDEAGAARISAVRACGAGDVRIPRMTSPAVVDSIEFELKNLDAIQPFGGWSDPKLTWFGMTDGYLRWHLGDQTLYEYTAEARDQWGPMPPYAVGPPYSDYYLWRFLADLTELFGAIREPVPGELFPLTEDPTAVRQAARWWLDAREVRPTRDFEECFDDVVCAESWISARLLDAGHLRGGPNIWFFRRGDTLRIVWDTEAVLDDGQPIWTARSGNLTVGFDDFVREIETFGDSFFRAMDAQVEAALRKNWGPINVDLPGLIDDHASRKAEFATALALLQEAPDEPTDWAELEESYRRMGTVG
ncbi:MAG: DUF5984 family protein [Gordonia sp. (in: high G+C Gram-positive bacteria)]|uniref:DUF5984 family protein n=1 Tax=Gordonia sp. (in: high G+C Gram-positive bacteria) TaxID=84139 RepID=UPI0039E54722